MSIEPLIIDNNNEACTLQHNNNNNNTKHNRNNKPNHMKNTQNVKRRLIYDHNGSSNNGSRTCTFLGSTVLYVLYSYRYNSSYRLNSIWIDMLFVFVWHICCSVSDSYASEIDDRIEQPSASNISIHDERTCMYTHVAYTLK